MTEAHPTSNGITDDRLRNTRAWAAARPDMSGSNVIVGAIDELLVRRSTHQPECCERTALRIEGSLDRLRDENVRLRGILDQSISDHAHADVFFEANDRLHGLLRAILDDLLKRSTKTDADGTKVIGLSASLASRIDEELRGAVETPARPVDEITAWCCRNCGDLHTLRRTNCGCGWTRERSLAEFGSLTPQVNET